MFRASLTLCILLCVLVPVAMADTVLLYTMNDDFGKDDYAEADDPKRAPSVTIVEDGVMSLFFDNGHIIFNAGYTDRMYSPFDAEPLAYRLAKNGGANLLLEVALSYAQADEGVYATPITARYRLVEIPSEKILTEALLETASLREGGIQPSGEELCFMLGQSIAAGVLSTRAR